MSPAHPAVPAMPAGQRVGVTTVAVVLGAALAVAGVVMLSQGRLLLGLAGAVLLAADALAVGYLARFLLTPRGAPTVLERGDATVLPESPWARVTAWGTLGASLLFLAVLIVVAVVSEGPTGGPAVGVIAAVAVLVLAVPTVLGVLHRRVRPGELVLSSTSVLLASWNADREIRWDDLTEVSLVADPRRTVVLYARTAEQVTLGRTPRGPGEQQARSVAHAERALAISFPHLTGDPARLAAALEHWRVTPADRHELGTPLARQRLGAA